MKKKLKDQPLLVYNLFYKLYFTMESLKPFPLLYRVCFNISDLINKLKEQTILVYTLFVSTFNNGKVKSIFIIVQNKFLNKI